MLSSHSDQTALCVQTEFRNTALDMSIFSEEALKPMRLHAQSRSLMYGIYKYIYCIISLFLIGSFWRIYISQQARK